MESVHTAVALDVNHNGDDLETDFYEQALETAPDGIIVVDDKGVIHFVNRQAETMFGWPRDQLLGQPVEMLVPARVREHHPQHRAHYFGSPNIRPMAANLVLTGQRADGSEFPVDISLSPLETKNGLWVSAAIRDATVRKRAESELRDANQQMAQTVAEMERQRRELDIVSEMGDMLQSSLSTEEAYHIITACARKLFPHTSGAVYRPMTTQTELEAVSNWGDKSALNGTMAAEDCWALRRGRLHRSTEAESAFVCRHVVGNRTKWNLCVPLLAHGEVLGLLLLRQTKSRSTSDAEARPEDIERLAVTVAEHLSLALANLKLRENLQIQSNRDPLTALYNRRFLDETVDQELDRARREHYGLSMLLVDIDDFKSVNDDRGHQVGDSCLRSLARILEDSTRVGDIVCRLGGDEFAVLLPDVSPKIAVDRAERIRSLAEHQLETTVSIGVAQLDDSIHTGIQLVKACDTRLYAAKKSGKNKVCSDREGDQTLALLA